MADILVINGSRHNETTEQVIGILRHICEKEQISMEVYDFQNEESHGCTGCGKCFKAGRCIFNEQANAVSTYMKESAALVVIADVYYGNLDERVMHLLDCLFHSNPYNLANKAATSLLVCRKAEDGAYAALSEYYAQANMIVITNQYHGCVNFNELTFEQERMVQNIGHALTAVISALKGMKVTPPDRTMHFIR